MNKPSYTWNAADYAAHSTAQLSWAQELINKLTFKGDEHILDIGCGDGKITLQLAERVPDGKVTGIDNSSAMISLAMETFPAEKKPQLEFLVMDARHLEFDHKFNIIFSNAALHWVIDHRPVLTGISKALAPGGSFLLQMGGAGNAADVVQSVNAIISLADWNTYFQQFTFPYGFYAPNEYAPWLESAGLHADRIELVPKDMVYNSREKLAGWFRTTWLPYLERVPKDRQANLVTAILDQYLEQFPPDANGNIHVRMVRLEVQGHKAL